MAAGAKHASRRREGRVRPARAAAVRPPATRWVIALVLLVGAVAYANSLGHPFIFDDFGSIVRNPQIRDLGNLGALFSPPADTGVAHRPIAQISFAVNYAVGGLDVTGYHIVNLALHLMCALLVFGVVRRTVDRAMGPGAGVGVGLATALVWAVHPLNSEVVDYLSERTESLMALCYLFTVYAAIRALDAPKPWRWYAAAIAACAAGMGCKESMITAPLMVVVYDRVFARERPARWPLYAGLAATWAFLLPSFLSRGAISSGGFATAHATPWSYLVDQTVMIARYLRLAVWPTSLVNYYGWAPGRPLTEVWPYALLLVALAAVTVVALVRRPAIGFAGAWFFITLAPSSSVIPIAGEVGAERRMYLPLVALIALAVVGARWLWRRLAPREAGGSGRAPVVVVAVIVCALGALTMARNRDYASALRMAETTLERWPTANAHQMVGAELAAAGRHEEAIAQFRAAVDGYPPSHYFLGKELVLTGQPAEAITELQRFIQDEPQLPVVPAARILMAQAYASQGEYQHAIDQLQLVLAGEPSDVDVQGLLADAYAGAHQFAGAIPYYQAFVAARPGVASAWTGLGVALVATDRLADAIDAFSRAAALSPTDGRLRVNLARALAAHGDLDKAAAAAQQAVSLSPSDPAAHDLLGRILANEGRLDEARREFERALQIDPSYAPALDALRHLPRG